MPKQFCYRFVPRLSGLDSPLNPSSPIAVMASDYRTAAKKAKETYGDTPHTLLDCRPAGDARDEVVGEFTEVEVTTVKSFKKGFTQCDLEALVRATLPEALRQSPDTVVTFYGDDSDGYVSCVVTWRQTTTAMEAL